MRKNETPGVVESTTYGRFSGLYKKTKGLPGAESPAAGKAKGWMGKMSPNQPISSGYNFGGGSSAKSGEIILLLE